MRERSGEAPTVTIAIADSAGAEAAALARALADHAAPPGKVARRASTPAAPGAVTTLTLPNGTRACLAPFTAGCDDAGAAALLAGVVDAALLAADAREPLDPQAADRWATLGLLGARAGAVALTGCAEMDAPAVEAAVERVRTELAGSWQSQAPIVAVDVGSGAGLRDLLRVLLSVSTRGPARRQDGPARLGIHRSAARGGEEAVANGLAICGALRAGDPVAALPGGAIGRVRGLSAGGRALALAGPGARCSVRVEGIPLEDLERASELATPGLVGCSDRITVTLHPAPGIAASDLLGGDLLVHAGRLEVPGRCVLAEPDTDRECASAVLELDAALPCLPCDRLVLARHGRVVGVALVGEPAGATPGAERLRAFLLGAARVVPLRAFAPEPTDDDRAAVDDLLASGEAVQLAGDRLAHRVVLDALLDQVGRYVAGQSARDPGAPGVPVAALRQAVAPGWDAGAFGAALGHGEAAGVLVVDQGVVGVVGYEGVLPARQQALLERLAQLLLEARYAPPTVKECARELRVAPDAVASMVRVGIDRGLLVETAPGLVFHRDTVEHARAIATKLGASEGHIAVGAFRDACEASRKAAVPLLEYFDATGFTEREGEVRVLAAPPAED